MTATLPGVAQDNLPAGWRKDWSAQYHTHFYVNIYTGESSWNVPSEPVYGDIKPSQGVSTTVNEVLVTKPWDLQPSPGGYTPSPTPVSASSTYQPSQEGYFPQQIHVQPAINTPHEAVPALFFPPPPSSGQSQTTQAQATVQQFPPPPSLDKNQAIQVANQAGVQHFPPPPPGPAPGQTLLNRSQQNTTPQYFPPPPPMSSRPSVSSQLQVEFPPPPPAHPETIVHQHAGDLAQTPQANLGAHLQTRPTPLTSKPRPRSFIGQMEMMKIQLSEQSHIYGAKAMETKLGSKVTSKVGKLIPLSKPGPETKETDPLLLDKEGTPPATKEEKKLWDDRTEEEKKASYKKWGKRAAIGAGVVAAVVIGAEAIEHAGNASDAASSMGSVGNHMSSGADAMAYSTAAANNTAMMAVASANMNAAAMSSAFSTMASANF